MNVLFYYSFVCVYYLIFFQMDEFNQACACGSGKKSGSCCMADEPCSCGSGDPAGSCCFAGSSMEEEDDMDFDDDMGFDDDADDLDMDDDTNF